METLQYPDLEILPNKASPSSHAPLLKLEETNVAEPKKEQPPLPQQSDDGLTAEDFKQPSFDSVFPSCCASLLQQMRDHPDIPILSQSCDIEAVFFRLESQLYNGSFASLDAFAKCVKDEWSQLLSHNQFNFWASSACERVYESFLIGLQHYQIGSATQAFSPSFDLPAPNADGGFNEFLSPSYVEPIGNLHSPPSTIGSNQDLALFTSPLNESSTNDILMNYEVPVYPGSIVDPRTEMDHASKKRLRDDLAGLPPSKLGEVMYVLRQAQPQNVEITGEQLVLDVKKLNNSTLLHLQAYVERIKSQLLQEEIQAKFNPNVVTARARSSRKRRRNPVKVNRPRKKRTSYTAEQKKALIEFWGQRMWQPCTDESILGPFAESIGVTSEQVKVFRQNNRKKHGVYFTA